MKEQIRPIEILPGVDKDNTPLATQFYTDADGIRFYNGSPEKVGGCDSLTFNNGATIQGACRTIYSQRVTNIFWTLYGTSSHLYSSSGTTLTNITPLTTVTTSIPNSLATNYTTLGSNPITTTLGSATVTIAHTAHKLQGGDSIILSGAAGVGGIPAGNFNTTQMVRSTTTNSYTIIVATIATSAATGGGASVIEATNLITVTQTAHGFLDGNRILIAGATTTGGIPNTEINIQHIIRNVTTNNYSFSNLTKATSAVTAGGGSDTTVQGEIPVGPVNASFGIGYGMGRYGVGLYGVAKTSSDLLVQPRIWSFDRFGNNVVMTPGSQTGLYQWTGNNSLAPALITNAPTAINSVFVSNEIIVTLGADGIPNRVKWSDQGNSTVWTGTAVNQAGEDDIEGAGEFLAQANVRGVNLLFTPTQLYTMRYLGRPLIWEIKQVDDAQGIIGPNAHVVVNGICYWMGQNDFYQYNGGVVSSMPSNSTTRVNYLRRYVFDNLSTTQYSKCFAWYNPFFNEVWFHYPDANSNECNRIARYNVIEQHWVPDTWDRTAAESPHILNIYPKLIGSNNIVYRHENGVNDDGIPLAFILTGPVFQGSRNLVQNMRILPDSIQDGTIDFTIRSLPYAQSTQPKYASTDGTNSTTPTVFSVEGTSDFISFYITNRLWQYTWEQDVLNGNWRMGTWIEYIKEGTPL